MSINAQWPFLESLSDILTVCRVERKRSVGVDDATMDADGGYWGTLVFRSALNRYLPKGSLDVHVKLPFSNLTNLCFGGEDFCALIMSGVVKGMAWLGACW